METTKTHTDLQILLKTIGNHLYIKRHTRREKLTSVASSIGISHSVLSLVENGRYRSLNLDILNKLCNYYGIGIEELFSKD